MGIHKLPCEVISVLRTGIIFNNSAQCVVELVLNALDAEATSVAVRVDLNIHKIQVIDNGLGMDHSQLDLIGSRYMTSKCDSLEDLYTNLNYFGFRGEALASLREVSGMLMVESRFAKNTNTYCKVFTHGKAHQVGISQTNRPAQGTTITVTDFMYNLPVRRQRMRHSIDLEEIKLHMEYIALVHPWVSFSLRNNVNGNVIMHTHKCPDTLNVFANLYGTTIANFLIPVNFESNKMKIHGYIGKESHSQKNIQFVYINKRLVLKSKFHKLINAMLSKSFILKSSGIKQAQDIVFSKEITVGQWLAFSPVRTKDKYAMFILNIECSRADYDICLVPTKTLVEFRDWEFALQCMEQCIRTFLIKESLLYMGGEINDSTIIHPEDSILCEIKQLAQEDALGQLKCLDLMTQNPEKKCLKDDFLKNVNSMDILNAPNILQGLPAKRNSKIIETQNENSTLTPNNNAKFPKENETESIEIEEQHSHHDSYVSKNTLLNSVLSGGDGTEMNTDFNLCNAVDTETRFEPRIERPLKSIKEVTDTLDSEFTELFPMVLPPEGRFKQSSHHPLLENFHQNTRLETGFPRLNQIKKQYMSKAIQKFAFTVDRKVCRYKMCKSKCNTVKTDTELVTIDVAANKLNLKSGNDGAPTQIHFTSNGIINAPRTRTVDVNLLATQIPSVAERNNWPHVGKVACKIKESQNCINNNITLNKDGFFNNKEMPLVEHADTNNVSVSEYDILEERVPSPKEKAPNLKDIMQLKSHLKSQHILLDNMQECQNQYLTTSDFLCTMATKKLSHLSNIHPLTDLEKLNHNFQSDKFEFCPSFIVGNDNVCSSAGATISPDVDLKNKNKLEIVQSKCFKGNDHNTMPAEGFDLNWRKRCPSYLISQQNRSITEPHKKLKLYQCANYVVDHLQFCPQTTTCFSSQNSGHDGDNEQSLSDPHFNIHSNANNLKTSSLCEAGGGDKNTSLDIIFASSSSSEDRLVINKQGTKRKTSNHYCLNSKIIKDNPLNKEGISNDECLSDASFKQPIIFQNYDGDNLMDSKIFNVNFDGQGSECSEDCLDICNITGAMLDIPPHSSLGHEMQNIKCNIPDNEARKFQTKKRGSEVENDTSTKICIPESNTRLFTADANGTENSKNTGENIANKINSITFHDPVVDEPIRSKVSWNKDPLISKFTNDNVHILKSPTAFCTQQLDNAESKNIEQGQPNKSLDPVLSKHWVQMLNSDGKPFYMQDHSGVTSFDFPPALREQGAFSMSRRYDFLPKGMSPILVERAVGTSNELTPNSRRAVHHLLNERTSYPDQDLLVKWRTPQEPGCKDLLARLLVNAEKRMEFCEREIHSARTEDMSRNAVQIYNISFPYTFNKTIFSNLIVIGQLDQKFIVTLTSLGDEKEPHLIVLFDQHAVHERIRLEKLMKDYLVDDSTSHFKSSQITSEIQLHPNEKEVRLLSDFREEFTRLGLEYEIVDESNVRLSSVPTCLHLREMRELHSRGSSVLKTFVESLIREQVESLLQTRGVGGRCPATLHNVIASEACRGAIKFGDLLSKEDCKVLLSSLALCDLPFQCAHGRPSLVPIADLHHQHKQKPSKPQLWKLKCNKRQV